MDPVPILLMPDTHMIRIRKMDLRGYRGAPWCASGLRAQEFAEAGGSSATTPVRSTNTASPVSTSDVFSRGAKPADLPFMQPTKFDSPGSREDSNLKPDRYEPTKRENARKLRAFRWRHIASVQRTSKIIGANDSGNVYFPDRCRTTPQPTA